MRGRSRPHKRDGITRDDDLYDNELDGCCLWSRWLVEADSGDHYLEMGCGPSNKMDT